MSTANYGRNGKKSSGNHQWPVWAGRIALLLSALISPLTGLNQARANTIDQAQLISAVLHVHNQVRTAVHVPPVEWSDILADRAAAWAEHLTHLGYMIHSGSDVNVDEGENIWMGTAGAFSYDVMVGDWAKEGQLFKAGYFPHISTTGNWEDAGHFTQMIWRETRKVGCAVASGGGWDFLVCRYSAPGNIMGRKPY